VALICHNLVLAKKRACEVKCERSQNCNLNLLVMKLKGSHRGASTVTPLLRFTVLGAAVATLAMPAQAAFHLWQLREIYSNASGNLQYIEMFCPDAGQTFLTGQQISVTSGGTTHTFTLGQGLPGGGDSANHALLFGTSGIQAAGAPAPNYIIANGFLFTGGATISFFGANSGTYTALPTDGVQSRNWADGNAVNNPQNYAGTVGQVVVPEPATWAIFGLGAIGSWLVLRRRTA
jgi:hypothetical protein